MSSNHQTCPVLLSITSPCTCLGVQGRTPQMLSQLFLHAIANWLFKKTGQTSHRFGGIGESSQTMESAHWYSLVSFDLVPDRNNLSSKSCLLPMHDNPERPGMWGLCSLIGFFANHQNLCTQEQLRCSHLHSHGTTPTCYRTRTHHHSE